MSKELGFSVIKCKGQGEADWGFGIWDLGFGCSYQTLPAEMSRRPSLLKSPMPTPSERKARSRVVFLKVILEEAVAFGSGLNEACACGCGLNEEVGLEAG